MCPRSNSALVPPLQKKRRQEEESKGGRRGSRASWRALRKSEEVRRYSTVERRERIERYRSKRNRRNFQKKITYACRKALADRRQRIKGRFAHTGDGDQKVCLAETTDQGSSSSSRSTVPEWWPAMEAALARKEEVDGVTKLLRWDWEMLASYLGINLCCATDPSRHPST
ncbi:zinc finger protein CONSTANS-LIKE 15-like [Hordeum vulgare subsp. vulgare]|uniref:CCT domain-containing protein n=1 Tax=Hordeum vulgare subsp. vulgare TaxID=112509 RepID=A0A8I6XR10_HORVV|nr:zinc finger protein CONSTANS-LIKE 15-like [Hordeum vulgare subsp. vulgare]